MAPPRIATHDFVLTLASGRTVSACVAVGMPELGADGVARCPVQIEGVDPIRHVLVGDTTLQALVLALRFVATLLRSLVDDRGGHLTNTDGSPLELDAIFAELCGAGSTPSTST